MIVKMKSILLLEGMLAKLQLVENARKLERALLKKNAGFEIVAVVVVLYYFVYDVLFHVFVMLHVISIIFVLIAKVQLV